MLSTYRLDSGVATITMARPDRLNTMTDAFLEDLLTAVETAADDDTARAVILTGEGRAFCAGGDLRAGIGGGVGGPGPIVTATGNLRRYMRIAQLLHDMPKPTIAAVHGACAGAGMALACASDLRYADRSAVFATAFLGAGLSGDFGGSWTLTQILGTARAREAYLLGARIPAEEACRIGLVSEVVDEGDLLAHVGEVAARLAAAPSAAVRGMMANLNDAQQVGFTEALDREAARHIAASRTPDAREATLAFLEKRPAVFD